MCLWEYYYFFIRLKRKKNNTWGNPHVYQPTQIYVLILKYNTEDIIGKNTSFLQKEKLLGLWSSHLRSRYLLIKQHFLESIIFIRKWKFMRILLRKNESQLSPIFSCPKWISLSLQKCQQKATSGHIHHLYPALPLDICSASKRTWEWLLTPDLWLLGPALTCQLTILWVAVPACGSAPW